jgi:hypothetical protein
MRASIIPFAEINEALKSLDGSRIDFFSNHRCQWGTCHAVFSDAAQLAFHVRSEHLLRQKQLNRKEGKTGCCCQWRTCDVDKPFPSFYNVETHIGFKHTKHKPFGCDECEWRFVQRSDVEAHMAKRHGKRKRGQEDDPDYIE